MYKNPIIPTEYTPVTETDEAENNSVSRGVLIAYP